MPAEMLSGTIYKFDFRGLDAWKMPFPVGFLKDCARRRLKNNFTILLTRIAGKSVILVGRISTR
jgi:hypothetical protein